MVDENVPAQAPTRSDDQILLFATWVPIGKSNYVLDIQKKQKNPIFQISNGTYGFDLDETRFILDVNLLREALEITSIDQAHQFVSSPLGEAIMDFVNELGYTKNAPYYNAYLEMVAKHDWKVTAKKEGKMKTASAKQPKLNPAIEKSSKPAHVPKLKATNERPSKASSS
nr:hypothetical protein [Tanacetum cinerariifolium]